jgi:hypothetical protein
VLQYTIGHTDGQRGLIDDTISRVWKEATATAARVASEKMMSGYAVIQELTFVWSRIQPLWLSQQVSSGMDGWDRPTRGKLKQEFLTPVAGDSAAPSVLFAGGRG